MPANKNSHKNSNSKALDTVAKKFKRLIRDDLIEILRYW